MHKMLSPSFLFTVLLVICCHECLQAKSVPQDNLKRIINEALDALEEIEDSNVKADEANKLQKKRTREDTKDVETRFSTAEEKHIEKRVSDVIENQAQTAGKDNNRKRSEEETKLVKAQVQDGNSKNVQTESREESAATVQVENNFDNLMEFVLRSIEEDKGKSNGEKNTKEILTKELNEKQIKDNTDKILCDHGCNALEKKEKLIKKSSKDERSNNGSNNDDDDKEIRLLLDSILSKRNTEKRESLSTLIEGILENFSTK